MINYENIRKIDGWCTDDKIEKMINLIISTKPTNVVEIGVYHGKSLVCQALALKENSYGKICAIDPWNKKDAIEFIENLKNHLAKCLVAGSPLEPILSNK